MDSPASAQYRIDSWTTEEGLPQGSVNLIRQTRDGFLWFATFGGLARFDGIRFRVFDTTTNPEMKSSRIVFLQEDDDGQLWLLTQQRELLRYLPGSNTFVAYGAADGLPSSFARMIYKINGRLSVDTGDAHFLWSGGRFLPHTPPFVLPKGAVRIGRSLAGATWYRDDSGVHRHEEGRPLRTLPFAVVGQVHEDVRGRVWFKKGTDLVCLDGETLTTYGAREGVEVSLFTADEGADGSVWFFGAKGMLRFRDGRFSLYTVADGLPGGGLQTMYSDREGTMWIGTSRGVAHLTDRPIATYARDAGLGFDNTYPVLADSRGDIWIGGWSGLARHRNGVFESLTDRLRMRTPNVTTLFEDREGVVWVGSLGGPPSRIVKDRLVPFVTTPDAATALRVIYQGKGADLWFGGARGLLRYRDGQGRLFRREDGYAGGEVFAIKEDAAGALWVGNQGGLVRYANGRFTVFGPGEGFAGGTVRAIHEETDGTLWFGTYDSGLYRYREGLFTRFTTREGLPTNGAFAIVDDALGTFWISSNAGIYRVGKRDLGEVAAGRMRVLTAPLYGSRDGMLNSECNGGSQPSAVRARDGRIWFPTQQGVAVVDPAAIPLRRDPPLVAFLDLIVAGRPTLERDTIVIDGGSTSMEARFAALTFVRPEQSRYKYRMDGLDDDWVDAGNERTARYGQLPYGNFRFRVIAANREGIWNEEGASVAIVVVRPFWRTNWFAGLTAATIALLGISVHRWRIGLLRRQQELQEAFSRQLIDSQETDRARIASGLHDGLSQSLIVIKNWALAGQQDQHQTAASKARLSEIEHTAARALNEVREVVQDLVPYQIEHLGLAGSVSDMADRIGGASGIAFTCRLADLEGRLSHDAQVGLFRVIQEGVNNIVKHSGAQSAWLDMTASDTEVRVTLRDAGRGFAVAESRPEAGRGGFGLFGMAERMRMLGGRFSIDSAPGRGTTVLLELPIGAESGARA